MPKKKRGYLFIILGIVLVIVIIIGAYLFRESQKKHFDKLYNNNKILTVEYGIVPPKKVLMEKNALFKKVEQDNYYFLHITEDNTLFTYYLDWYYSFDPLKGYNLVYEMKLDDETIKGIMQDIKEKEITSLVATVQSDYLTIHHDDKQMYIKKLDLQMILQSHDILLNI